MRIKGSTDFKTPSQSYWMASTQKIDYPTLDEDIKIDVAIVGGGIAGISTAYQLIKEGVKVAIIEADLILRGTTGHTTAKVTSQHGLIYNKIENSLSKELAQQYADANESAIALMQDIVTDLKIDCNFKNQSAYVYTQQDDYVQKIIDEVKTAANLGIKADYVESIPLDIPVKAAVLFANQAQFHPLKYLLALAKEITDSGNNIYEHSRVIDIEEEEKQKQKESSYVLTTGQGKKIIAQKVIIASHYPFYNKAGLYFTRLYPERSYVVAIKAKQTYPGGMYISAECPTRSLRSQNNDSGELILVGGENHKTGQGEDTIKHYEALIAYANDNYSVEDIPYRWSTQDCMTMDDIPFVGHYTSKTPNMYIATGYGKWGMTNSAVSSIILKDLIVHGNSPWEDVYNPSRKDIIASAKNYVVENLNVAKELVKGKLTSPTPTEIKPGEARVVNENGMKIGEYMDEDGKLYMVNTTCTHMGCELCWNSAERSWDCPCHGSRFSYKGDVIEGPAVKPLKLSDDVNTIEKLIKDDF